jgi:hypothetical protein
MTGLVRVYPEFNLSFVWPCIEATIEEAILKGTKTLFTAKLALGFQGLIPFIALRFRKAPSLHLTREAYPPPSAPDIFLTTKHCVPMDLTSLHRTYCPIPFSSQPDQGERRRIGQPVLTIKIS